ncbi:hypothetical protein [Micromonospora auratinigra]|uniref:Uncharacterized protein n=1 Tax=Micromonospora auratinigra TaxID=261654 RepID=A0A1A8Z867_9ACTN|nr:hypothetical protein [Micromonospora auratinigra]SBT40050.1 hypothetical protein GA0070611_1117 [Micromonospora auratinigra]
MVAIPFRIPRPRPARLVLPLLVLALVAVSIVRFGGYADARQGYAVPHDGQLEAATGIRFTQAAVVGDGGLVELRYVVLDTQKASAFQNDTKHPPRLRNERSGKLAWRAALMKQGHELRPGQSYYLLYLNNDSAIRRGDKIEITSGQRHLAHVPVR